MFGNFNKNEAEPIENLIAVVMTHMGEYGPDSQEYPQLLAYLERLTTVRDNHRKPKINPDTFVIVGGNLLGILIIVAYEQKHVIVSKALAFVQRTK